ncbi:MAG TPA: class I SAM-dependent methyltransferase [Steroidobacteraceae bacterium]|nr:class I SAM-dependent methyltransferase [Steroidobacteraceae bacterium]
MNAATYLAAQPMVGTTSLLDCAVCGGRSWREVGRAQDYEYATCSNLWAFRVCLQCGHVQIDPLPAPETLRIIYPANYYSYQMEKSIHPIARWAKLRLDRAKFKWITGGMRGPVASYLDVGCGDGRYLQMVIGQGTDRDRAYGVELDAHAVQTARASGLNVVQSRIEDASGLSPDSFDLITMFHVIEHVASPGEVVARLRELLREGGLLAVETPNFDCMDARLSGRRFWGGYHAPRHWHLFTSASLCRLLLSHGFTIERQRFQTGHAFLLWTLHHWLKYGKGRNRLAAWCHPLGNVLLLALATSFDMLRIMLGCKTSAVLVVARKASKQAVGPDGILWSRPSGL